MSNLTPHIRNFVPDAEGEELEVREALMVARDYAAMLRTQPRTEWCLLLAAAAHEEASEFVFSNAPLVRLKAVRDYCRNLVQAANIAAFYDREGPR